MKNFLAVYMGTPAATKRWMKLDRKTRAQREKAGMQAWGEWVAKYHAAIVDHGAPLGKTKQADPKGITRIQNSMAAYTVVKAKNHAEAAKMFKNHPHFTLFPGSSVEIMECLPMPTI